MYEFRTPTHVELKRFYATATLPKIECIEGVFQGGELIGVGGILADPLFVDTPMEDVSRRIAFLDIRAEAPGLEVVRHLRGQLAKEIGPIWVQHDDKFPQSERLLRLLGFRPTHEWRRDYKNTDRQLRMWCKPAGHGMHGSTSSFNSA